MLKKVLTILITVALLVSSCVVGVNAADGETSTSAVWTGTRDSSWYTENASTKTVTITTPEQFAGLADVCTDNDHCMVGWTVNLGADLYFNTGSASDWAATAPANTWTPIPLFKGTLNGNGHSLNGLYFNNTSEECVGVFGKIGNTAVVKDLAVLNSYFKGSRLVGSIAGQILNPATKVTLTNLYSDAIVCSETDSNERAGLGGIVGCMIGTGTLIIDGCYFAGVAEAVSTDNNMATRVGGILGWLQNGTQTSTITNCLVTGTVIGKSQVGGIVGAYEATQSNSKTEHCAFFGKTVCTRVNIDKAFYGSLVGIVYSGYTSGISIVDCYVDRAYRAIKANDKVIISDPYATNVWSTNGSGALAAESVTKVSKADLIANGAAAVMPKLDTNTWVIGSQANHSLPALKSIVDQFADCDIRYSSFQTANNGRDIRFVAVLDQNIDLEQYRSVALKIEVVSEQNGTTVIEQDSAVVYTGIMAAGETVTAADLGGSYLYTYAITNIGKGENIQFNVTPVLTGTDGRVITGVTRSLFWCVTD